MTYRLRNIGLALALAVGAVLLVFYYVGQERNRLQDGEELVSVWVAAKNIPEGTAGSTLESGNFIEKTEVERDLVAPGALLQPNEVANEIAATTIYKGEQVSQLRFRSEAEKGIRGQLTGTLRAVQVPGTKDQLLAGTLESGDRVDVVSTIKYKFVNFGSVPTGTGNEELTATRTVLRDILVLKPSEQSGGDSKVGGNAADEELSVLLAVTDAQSQKLNFVTRPDGTYWTLQLRPALDAADSPESVETVGTILTDGLKAKQIATLVPGRSAE
jgi:Flp pilus assembly protein CpaB